MCDVVCAQMILDNVTNPVYSNYQVTQGNSGFKRDLILSPTASHLYALTAQQVSAKHCSLLRFGYTLYYLQSKIRPLHQQQYLFLQTSGKPEGQKPIYKLATTLSATKKEQKNRKEKKLRYELRQGRSLHCRPAVNVV